MEDDPIIDAQIEEVTEPKKKTGRPKGKKDSPTVKRARNEAKIVELAAKGVIPEDIAKTIGMSPQTVLNTIEKFKPVFIELANVDDYRTIKGDLLSAGQLAALKSAFSGSKLKKAGFLSTLQGFDLLNKAERLHNGQSTENNSINVFGKLQVTGIVGHTEQGDK